MREEGEGKVREGRRGTKGVFNFYAHLQFHIFDCSCVSEVIDVHCKVFELALQEWEQRESLGTSFTADVQKHVC